MSLVQSLVRNPFRILGVSSNDSAERVAKHVASILSAIEKGESISFATDFVDLLGGINRNEAALNYAKERLATPLDRLASAFFWFASSKASDAVAYTYLKEGNIEKAEKVYAKKEGYAPRINMACLSFMKKDLVGGIGQIARLIANDTDREEFVRSVAPGTLIGKDDLALLFFRELSRDVKLSEHLGLARIDTPEKAEAFLRNILALHERLAISVFNIGPARSMPIMALKSAERLLDTTASLLEPLKKELGVDTPLYVFVSSWIANEAMSMVVANINFLHTCPPGTETLRTESAKASVILKRLLTLDITEKLRSEIENNLKILEGIQANIREKHDKGRCFIATAAFGSYEAPEVKVLRRFRDSVLKRTETGRSFVAFYYKNSPRWVEFMQGKPRLTALIRTGLRYFAWICDSLMRK